MLSAALPKRLAMYRASTKRSWYRRTGIVRITRQSPWKHCGERARCCRSPRILDRSDHDPCAAAAGRSEEHTSELQSLMRNSYAVFCFKKKNTEKIDIHTTTD